jgi:hypothetical protein
MSVITAMMASFTFWPRTKWSSSLYILGSFSVLFGAGGCCAGDLHSDVIYRLLLNLTQRTGQLPYQLICGWRDGGGRLETVRT